MVSTIMESKVKTLEKGLDELQVAENWRQARYFMMARFAALEDLIQRCKSQQSYAKSEAI